MAAAAEPAADAWDSLEEEAATPPDVDVFEEGGLRKGINGYTWPGIEFGEPPSCAYTFFEYCDAIRFGDLKRFLEIEAACKEWFFPTLDRGAGTLLHIAADHGQLQAAKFLIEQRGVDVNQQDRSHGWTPLMRAARVAHYQDRPHMELFEYLLQKGADASILSFPPRKATGPPGLLSDPEAVAPILLVPELRGPKGPLEVAANKGFGWEVGAVRAKLAELIERYRAVPKPPAVVYRGPGTAEEGKRLYEAWESLPKLYPPDNWRPPPPAGYEDAQGIRRLSVEGWRPAGDGDGSGYMRPMTEEELDEQSRNC
ncbi:hypothetical protein ABPG75_008396 [Micractinium tetrahymenae]